MQQVENQGYQDATRSVDERVQNLLSQMTLAEKIGQMTQVEKNSIKSEEVTEYFIGSVLSGGGGNPEPNNVHEWRKMVQAYMVASLKTRLGIPMIYGVDAVHGHSNVVGAVIFPHNVGLGAAHDADLIERIAQVTASEVLATNVHWDFAPAVSVPQDARWGRTYEGYSENTDLVSELGAAYVRGLQTKDEHDEWVLASVKHFAGDGGTTWDSRREMPYSSSTNWQAASPNWRIDQGDTRIDEATLRRIHLEPYKHTIDAGAENIMVSFSSWNGLKMHAHEYLLTEVLKGEWGFKGFLISDWMAVDQISEDYYLSVVTSVNAGMDMIMVPYDHKKFITTLTEAVEKGDVSHERIDDAVARILHAKFNLGMFEQPYTNESHVEAFGGDAHRALASEAVQKSLVLLKNDATLPVSKSANVALVGVAADNIGLACGGWTIDWQGKPGPITPGSTLHDGLQAQLDEGVIYSKDGDLGEKADVAIVVIAEPPYAEGEGDREDLTISAEDQALIRKTRANCDKLVLVIYSGRPLVLTPILDQCDAIVAAWLPGSEASAIADVLVGDVPISGKTAYTWYRSMDQFPLSHLQASGEDPLYPFGHGLSY